MANNQETKLTKDSKYNDIFELEDDSFEVFPGQASVKELFEKVESIVDKINAIDDEQYAKKGISSSQESAITANTAKVGITTSQAASITSSASKVANLEMGRVVGVPTNIKNVTAQIRHSVQINAKTGVAVIARTVILSNGNTYTSSETLTAQKS